MSDYIKKIGQNIVTNYGVVNQYLVGHEDYLKQPYPSKKSIQLYNQLIVPAGVERSDAVELVSDNYKFFPQNDYFSDWNDRGDLAFVAAVSYVYIKHFELFTKDSANLLYKAGWLASEWGDHGSAEKYLDFARIICKKFQMKPLESRCLTEIANVHYRQRKFKSALEKYEEVLKIRRECAMGDEWIAQAYCNIIMPQIELGFNSSAEDNVHTALKYWDDDVKNDNKGEYSWGLQMLACVQLRNNNFNDALVSCQTALDIKVGQLKKDHPLISYFLSTEAAILLKMGSFGKARMQAEKAYRQWINSYKDDHPVSASFGFTFAKTLEMEGNLKQAIDILVIVNEVVKSRRTQNSRSSHLFSLIYSVDFFL